ncbi:MAG: hypothetical protein ACM31J_07655 [Nitrososphaerales archaeon]
MGRKINPSILIITGDNNSAKERAGFIEVPEFIQTKRNLNLQ